MNDSTYQEEILNLENFLSYLHSLDIELSVDGERLRLNAPKGAMTETLRELIKQHKAAIFDFYRHKSGDAANIPHCAADESVHCSFAQQRLWLLDRLVGIGHAYNIPLFFRVLGDLQVNTLQLAMNEIVRRHAVLRTVFGEPEGRDKEPRQITLPELEIETPIIDLTDLAEIEVESKIQERAIGSVETPFDLAQAPLLRLNILKMSAQHHVLLFTVHHIVFDGLSVEIFLQELGALYTAFSQDKASPLKELDIQYADYSIWQRNRLTGKNLEEHLDFWRRELAGAPPVLGLPTDHPRPVVQDYAGARQQFDVDAATARKFRTLSRQNGATLFMAFHATLAILLARYSGNNDIVIGAPIANRNHRQLEALIGFFANTLVLRSEIKPDDSFNELLAQIRDRALQTYKFQELPFERLVDELKIERSMSHNPLFQVLFSYQDAHTERFALPGVDILPLAFDYTVSKFDLSFIVRERQDNFTIILEYSTALFEAATIKRMMGHFRVLLDAIVKQPQLPVGELPMLTAQDARQLQAWNETAVKHSLNNTLVELFATQVERTPDHIAVEINNQRLTYRQLNARANQLAHYLLQHTACKQTRNPLVAICLERSLDMVIGLLGILKAGAAYVPIDPAYPTERIRHMLTDSDVAVVVTQDRLKDTIPLHTRGKGSPQVLCLDEGIFESPANVGSLRRVQPGDLAYVIYTSGSTGKPKGVMIEHCSLTNFLLDMQQRTGITADDGLLAVTTPSFDIAALELFLPLIVGGCVHLVDNPSTSDVTALQRLLEDPRITFMQATPATWQLLRHSGWQATQPLSLLCGGEPLPPELANYLLENSAKLWNVYGPTETTIWSSAYRIQSTFDARPPIARPPIGRPIANTRIYLLNTQKNIQPVGIPGELCIAGEGLARGYLNRPELTREKFIDMELFGKHERVYKTGDLARWLPNGDLEYLGRIDHLVKIRGFRIEPGEIETVLAKHPQVDQALVIARTTASGEKQLVAYVQGREQGTGDAPGSVQLKSWLQEALPDCMIPAFFIVLDSFPLLPNGKVNRPALPQPDCLGTQDKGYMYPRNSLELALSQRWEDVLGISPVGVFDDFFDLGGDSLLAVRLTSTINQQLGVNIPQHSLFQNGTIEQQACLLRSDTVITNHTQPLVALQTEGDKPPIFCVHAAGGIVFRYLQIAKRMNSRYGHPFYGLQAKGIEPGETPYVSIEDMAQHYVQAVRRAKPRGPYLLAGWSMGGSVAFEMARRLESMGETVSGVIMIDAPSPYMDAYEADDIDFLLERLEPAAGVSILDAVRHQESAQAKKQYILEQKKQLGLFPPDITLAEAEQRLAVHKHHNQLLCRYQPGAAIEAGIGFIKATDATAFDEKMKDPVTSWAEFTHRGIAVYESPGNHFNMFSNEHGPVLATQLQACIQALGV